MLVVNLAGEPGAGKSTMAAGLFFDLKSRRWNVELVTEYTKELLAQNDHWSLADELVIFTEKYTRIKRMSCVDIVITDSPLINSAIHSGDQLNGAGGAFYEQVADTFDNLYLAITRSGDYVTSGRMETQEQAQEKGYLILEKIRSQGHILHAFPGQKSSLTGMTALVETHARKRGFSPFD